MKDKVLIGYSGNSAFGICSFYKISGLKEQFEKAKTKKPKAKIRKQIKALEEKRNKSGQAVYVSREKYEKIKEHQKLHEYDYLLE